MKIMIETDNSGMMKVISDDQGGGINGLDFISTLLNVAIDAAKRYGSTKEEAKIGLTRTMNTLIDMHYENKEVN